MTSPTFPRKRKPSYIKDKKTNEITITPRKKLLGRFPKKQNCEDALDELQIKLSIATELFEHFGDGGRTGVWRAVLDTIDFLESQGFPLATVTPLEAIADAIANAEQGTGSPIFKPDRNPSGGKPPLGLSELYFNGIMAAITELCVRHCKLEGRRAYLEPGCRKASHLVRESHWQQKLSWVELRELRERVREAAKDSIDRQMFDCLLESEFATSKPLDMARTLITHDWVVPPPSLNFPAN